MNHFMLPHSDNDPQNPVSTSARYGTYAMEILINHLTKLGAKRSNFEAKVFGGGNVLRGFTVSNVGASNADFVLDFCAPKKSASSLRTCSTSIYARCITFPKLDGC